MRRYHDAKDKVKKKCKEEKKLGGYVFWCSLYTTDKTVGGDFQPPS